MDCSNSVGRCASAMQENSNASQSLLLWVHLTLPGAFSRLEGPQHVAGNTGEIKEEFQAVLSSMD